MSTPGECDGFRTPHTPHCAWLVLGAVIHRRVFLQLGQLVHGFDETNRAGAGAHNQRAGGGAVLAVADTAEHVAVGHAGGHEVAVIGRNQVIGGQDGVKVQACVLSFGYFLVVFGF